MTFAFRQRLLATTLLVGAGLAATPAYAQTASPQPADATTVPKAPEATTTSPVQGVTVPTVNAQGANVESSQDIIVTGSRIPSA